MSNIKIEIPATDPQAQRIFAEALIRYAEVNEDRIRGFVEAQSPQETFREKIDEYIGDVELPQSAQVEEMKQVFDQHEPVAPPPPVTPQDIVKEEHTVAPPPPPSADVPPPPTVTPPSTDVPPPPPPVAVTDLPWDERIHASSKVKNQDGSWKARRKPPTMTQEDWDRFVKDVEAELQVLMKMRPNTPTTANSVTFAELMVMIKPHLVNPDFVARSKEICDDMSLPNGIADLSRNESLIPQFIEEIGLDG